MRKKDRKATEKSLLSRYSANLGQLVARRRSEQALRAAAIESRLANRAKSEFLANMSHELRTPLNAIIGFSGLIEDLGGNDEVHAKASEYASHIQGAGKHLLAIISDILDLSKIESGSFSLDLQRQSIGDAVESGMAIIKPRIDAKKQTLTVRISDEIPAFEFDRRRVTQVLINLLSNAHKFTPEGGAIALTVSVKSANVMITIIDTGIGMTRDQLNYALQPFGQINSAYNRGHDGTGLGLPISKALVEQHNGSFFISSEPNVGTRVGFMLPLQTIAADEKVPAISAARALPVSRRHQQ